MFLFNSRSKGITQHIPTPSRLYLIVLGTLPLLIQKNPPTCFNWLEVGISEGVQYGGYDLAGCPVVWETDTNVSQGSSAFIGPFFLIFCRAFLPFFLIAAFRNFLRQPFNYFLPSGFLKCYLLISVALAVSRCSIQLTLVSIHRNLLCQQLLFSFVITYTMGHVVVQLFEALRYKPEGRGFDSRLWHWNFSLT
jgi:hypothetical protein